ncbi:hypothetical protein HPB49_007556 [Dermacentor silvarum]|uniref:Uncharacterized protein n=1 Tax=Dermacentor silvarum TaxID=543639 RepID=A0ACB8C835_DERSI|nr:hypothetical protein HPB49_007556 [Dermacentor silvarum]
MTGPFCIICKMNPVFEIENCCNVPAQVSELVSKMLGYKLVTKQTPKDGVLVNKVMIAEALDIARETYLAILMDRSYNGPVVVASPAGGVDIEDVAEKTPHLIFKEPISILEGITHTQAQKIAKNLNFKGPLLDKLGSNVEREPPRSADKVAAFSAYRLSHAHPSDIFDVRESPRSAVDPSAGHVRPHAPVGAAAQLFSLPFTGPIRSVVH